jgi:hypothetical protein
MSKKYSQNRICEPGKGIRCHCGWISERRTHREITAKLLAQPFYYKQWYQCTNPDCPTKMFVEEKDKVINKGKTTRGMLKYQEREILAARFQDFNYNFNEKIDN